MRVLGDRIERDAEQRNALPWTLWLCASATTSADGVDADGSRARPGSPAGRRTRRSRSGSRAAGRDPHVTEAQAERVDPEVVGELGIAHGDVAGDALPETESAEDPQRRRASACGGGAPHRPSRTGGPASWTSFGVRGMPSMDRVSLSVRAMPERYPGPQPGARRRSARPGLRSRAARAGGRTPRRARRCCPIDRSCRRRPGRPECRTPSRARPAHGWPHRGP